MPTPQAYVFDVQYTSVFWQPATGLEERAAKDDQILVPRPGLKGLLHALWERSLPVVFSTDGDEHDILAPLNDTLHRMGLDDMDYYFVSTGCRKNGNYVGKSLKAVADAVRVPLTQIIFFGDTIVGPTDILSAQEAGVPFVHMPSTPEYHGASHSVLSKVGFDDLHFQKQLSRALRGDVLDFSWQGELWVPSIVSYTQCLDRYYANCPSSRPHIHLTAGREPQMVDRLRVH